MNILIMSKPNISNRIFCPQSGKFKLQFETEKKANLFIQYNLKDFDNKKPSRVYYCTSCCCYHITSQTHEKKHNSNKPQRDDYHIEKIAKKFGMNNAKKKEIDAIEKYFNKDIN